MKNVFLALGVLIMFAFGCEQEPLPLKQPVVHKAASSGIPAYDMGEMTTLLSDQQSEVAFLKKTEIVSYVLTRWLGEHANEIGLTGPGSLSGVLPCGQGWMGDGGILRTLGTLSGKGEAVVISEMSSFVEGCVKGCTLPPAQAQNLLLILLDSLTHQGTTYELRNHYTSQDQGGQPHIFISHGISARSQGLRALGFEYNLQSKNLIYSEKTLVEALNEGMLLLDARPIDGTPGMERFYDPCWQGTLNGGGGGSGGGPGLDDDGEQRNYNSGPLSIASPCQGDNFGLRVTAFHLADRNEGGLFGGKSEVVVSLTHFNSGDPSGTYVTNGAGRQRSFQDLSNVTINYREGKLLAEVDPSDISGQVNTVIYPNGKDWTLINQGICDQTGVDRFILTFQERDRQNLYGTFFSELPGIYWGDNHFCKMTMQDDVWYSNGQAASLQVSTIKNNGGFIYLWETQGGYATSTTQPAASVSWFRIEFF